MSCIFRGNTVSATEITQFEASFTPGLVPVIVANSSVTATPARLPQVDTLARGADGTVTIQSSGLLGTPYRVQSSSTLEAGDWTTVAFGIITESPFTTHIPGQNEMKMFYRIAMP